MLSLRFCRHAAIAIAVLLPISCAPQQRMGMVVDPATGLQYGSVIEKNLLVDASQFSDKSIKVNIRNTSGDPAFDLHGFRAALENAYRAKGYEPTRSAEFAILIDINVMYSGQISQNMTNEFGFLGAAGGGVAGAAIGGDTTGAVAGILSGLAIGVIVGSHVSEDTYIVVAQMKMAIKDWERGTRETTIVFSASDTEEEEVQTGIKAFRDTIGTGIAVYAGGRNVTQSRFAENVRQLFVRILSDVI